MENGEVSPKSQIPVQKSEIQNPQSATLKPRSEIKDVSINLPLLVAFVIIIMSGGCTLLGLGTGAIVDAAKPDRLDIPARELQAVKRGTQIEIITPAGDTLTGKYGGLVYITEEEYGKTYQISRENEKNAIVLPELGDSLTITLSTGEQTAGLLLGFDNFKMRKNKMFSS